VPVVLRAHNVESALWRFAAPFRGSPAARWMRREARRLERWEAACLRRVACTVALTGPDASGLGDLGGSSARIVMVRAPFRSELASAADPLPGDPPVVVLASGSWQPNRDAVWRFATDTWPAIRDALPQARLHVFGVPELEKGGPGVAWHPPPRDSIEAFPGHAVMVVPARHPTGVPMKCLEAWARGVPLVGVRDAAEQLAARDGEAMLVADTPQDFASALARLAADAALRRRLVATGRTMLREHHEPGDIARQLAEVYQSVRTRGT
jgi:glycosyltransferase involved in cell wall biosynthesis